MKTENRELKTENFPRRLLVIAYYFPPMGLSGVQRITKFVKYLPENGWAPTVLTTEPAGYFAFDESLMDDLKHPAITVERVASPDPTRFFGRKTTVALPAESPRRLLTAASQFVFVPDNKIGWKKPAIRRAEALHRQQPFDAILSTLPPYTNGLIAAELGKRWGVPVTLDFRDDWLGNPRHLYPTPLHRWMHRRLEKKALTAASHVVAINEPIAGALRKRLVSYTVASPPVSVLSQGYDPGDFEGLTRTRADDRLRFLYTGVFYDVQTPDYFLRGLAAFLETAPAARSRIEARFVGLLPASSRELIDALRISDVVTMAGYLPHRHVVQELVDADVLWMTVGHGPGQETISTGKLFEYMGARKPILGLVPAGAARETLEAYGASVIVEPDDVPAISDAISRLSARWTNGDMPVPGESTAYDRQKLTARLSEML